MLSVAKQPAELSADAFAEPSTPFSGGEEFLVAHGSQTGYSVYDGVGLHSIRYICCANTRGATCGLRGNPYSHASHGYRLAFDHSPSLPPDMPRISTSRPVFGFLPHLRWLVLPGHQLRR